MKGRKAERRARPLPLPIANGIRLPPVGWPDPTPVSIRTRALVDRMTTPFTYADLQEYAQKIYDAPPSLFDPTHLIYEGERIWADRRP